MSSFFTDTILERGKKYFEQNRVFSVNQKGDQTYTGIVLGSEAYHTKIIVDDTNQVIDAICDCPYAKDGHHCKNEAALYFAIEERLPKDEQQYIDINALLKRVRARSRSSYMLKREFNEEFKKYLSEDRVEINSVEYTNLGLIQFTRKRQGKELAFYYKEKCQYCEGTGYFLSKDRIILNLLAELNSQIKYNDLNKIVIKTKKDIIKELNKYIDNNKIK